MVLNNNQNFRNANHHTVKVEVLVFKFFYTPFVSYSLPNFLGLIHHALFTGIKSVLTVC